MPGLSRSITRDHDAEHQEIAQNHEQARGKQLVQRVDVRGEARDQAADRVVIVESHIQALQMRHQLRAQIEHGLLSDPLHQVLLAEVAKQRGKQSGEIEQ